MVLSSFCGIASRCKLVKSDQHETYESYETLDGAGR